MKTLFAALMVVVLLQFSTPSVSTEYKDDFYNGALTIYALEVPHSVENSERFIQFITNNWRGCSDPDTCYSAGVSIAKTFKGQ